MSPWSNSPPPSHTSPSSSSDQHRRRWAVLVATIWIQAFTGTNFDFSAYSSSLKSALGASQVQLNYLAVASDLGKALGWSAGLAVLRLPLWAVLLLAAAMGFAGYAMQWLLLAGTVSLPYFAVFLLCLLAGVSICWFNTVCFVLCARNFPAHRPLALSLTVSFNGVSAALYTLIANAVASSSHQSLYLLLNAAVPLGVSLVALVPVLRQPPAVPAIPGGTDAAGVASQRADAHVFSVLNVLAFVTGLYLLFLNSASSNNHVAARVLLGGAIVLLVLPLFVPGVVTCSASRAASGSPRLPVVNPGNDDDDPELRKGLITRGNDDYYDADNQPPEDTTPIGYQKQQRWRWCCWSWSATGGNTYSKLDINKYHDPLLKDYSSDRLTVLGEEHTPRRLVRRTDFWLYYATYFCGATVGLVYSNNLGQIAQSLGRESETAMLVSVYSACSFFGRLLSSAPDLFRSSSFRKLYLARTGWLALALLPMPLAFFLLATAGDGHALLAGTALVGLSSGFIFAAAVSVTSELFGPNSIGLNHNILITNIPLGSLFYGLLAALIYDANGTSSFLQALLGDGATVCMGRRCYAATFVSWGCITLVGLVSGVVLFARTRPAYDRYERNRAAAMVLQ